MSTNAQPDPLALLAAEEVLRTIYGDDLKGCTVSLESIATIIETASKQKEAQTEGLLDVYDKVIEAIHLLSTPPDISKVSDPKELNSILSQRLDAIRVVTTKTIETTSIVKPKRGNEPSGQRRETPG